MKPYARDASPAERPPLTLVSPPPRTSLTEQLVLLAVVLGGLVACAFYAGNAPFGAAAALSLALLARASYLANGIRVPPDVQPLRQSPRARR